MQGLNVSKDFTIKFIYSEKASKFCKISILISSYVVPVKSKVKISQNFVAFLEYMNFTNTPGKLHDTAISTTADRH